MIINLSLVVFKTLSANTLLLLLDLTSDEEIHKNLLSLRNVGIDIIKQTMKIDELLFELWSGKRVNFGYGGFQIDGGGVEGVLNIIDDLFGFGFEMNDVFHM